MLRITRALAFLAALFASPAVAAEMREIRFGVAEYEGPKTAITQARQIGAGQVTQYLKLPRPAGDPEYDLTHVRMPEDIKPTIALQFREVPGGIHNAILGGRFDVLFDEMIGKIIAAGQPVTFRIMPEPNGWWSAYGGYFGDQTPETFVAAYRYIVDYLRNGLGEEMIAGLELNLNRASFNKERRRVGTADFADFYPGDEYVTAVLASSYNRCGTSVGRTEVKSFAGEYRGFYEAALQFNEPLGVAEVASSPYCDVELDRWYRDMFASLQEEFVEVEVVYFFFENVKPGKASNDVETRWGAVLSAHPDLLRQLIKPLQKRADAEVVPRVQTAAAPKIELAPTRVASGVYWQSIGSAGRVFDQINDGVSPVTGEAFGRTGFLAQGNLRGGLFWEVAPDTELRLFGELGFVQGENSAQWWNNRVYPAVGLEACTDAPSFADWGSLCLTGTVRYDFYTVDTPDRLNGGALVGLVGGRWAFGGRKRFK